MNFNASQLKSLVKSSNIDTSLLKPLHFSLSHLTLPLCLTFLSILSSPGSQRAELEADYSCVRVSLRPSSSSGKLKTYAFASAPYCLKFQSSRCLQNMQNTYTPLLSTSARCLASCDSRCRAESYVPHSSSSFS